MSKIEETKGTLKKSGLKLNARSFKPSGKTGGGLSQSTITRPTGTRPFMPGPPPVLPPPSQSSQYNNIHNNSGYQYKPKASQLGMSTIERPSSSYNGGVSGNGKATSSLSQSTFTRPSKGSGGASLKLKASTREFKPSSTTSTLPSQNLNKGVKPEEAKTLSQSENSEATTKAGSTEEKKSSKFLAKKSKMLNSSLIDASLATTKSETTKLNRSSRTFKPKGISKSVIAPEKPKEILPPTQEKVSSLKNSQNFNFE